MAACCRPCLGIFRTSALGRLSIDSLYPIVIAIHSGRFCDYPLSLTRYDGGQRSVIVVESG